jgi:hypothetical protein
LRPLLSIWMLCNTAKLHNKQIKEINDSMKKKVKIDFITE